MSILLTVSSAIARVRTSLKIDGGNFLKPTWFWLTAPCHFFPSKQTTWQTGYQGWREIQQNQFHLGLFLKQCCYADYSSCSLSIAMDIGKGKEDEPPNVWEKFPKITWLAIYKL